MIDRSTAAELLDFGARIGSGERAEEQLDGAVALHNLLCKHHVAYLADEVGMGKTYVALGVLALFRHYQPDFRVLILAPREIIQRKWIKEFRNFVAHIVRFPDFRVKALDGRPSRELIACHSLVQLVAEATLDPDRDFFARMTSFSLPASGRDSVDPESARRLRDQLWQYLPWLRQEIFDLRDKQGFKDHVAQAICCALPVFDLVIVDEGHNLKHGFATGVSSRNRVLSLAFGHADGADRRLFPNYGPRARRVLFLSATPIENDYRQLWNQLDVFGFGSGFPELRRADLDEEEKKRVAHQFLIRRVTAIRINGQDYTKNLYRREWRNGGVQVHDEPIRIEDDRQRLIVALVQKKVAELLGSDRFNNQFQIGMLASFESFLETTKVKRADEEESFLETTNVKRADEEVGTFDNREQVRGVDDPEVVKGIDIADVNRLARSYRQKFGEELPHPKMDAVAESLARCWEKGNKTLVFVRRVASVKELKRKADETYDKWLIGHLKMELSASLLEPFDRIVQLFRAEKIEALQRGVTDETGTPLAVEIETEDRGGNDTFFAWFFRGEGPAKVVSGANIQQRFGQRSGAYSIFFEDNYVASALGCRPDQTTELLAERVGLDVPAMQAELRRRSCRFLSRAKKPARADRFEAVQAAAVEWLKDIPGSHEWLAKVMWYERFVFSQRPQHADSAPELGDFLIARTFFTELRQHHDLRVKLWPEPPTKGPIDFEATRTTFREQELRRQMLTSAARLGHAFIDLFILVIRRIGSFRRRAREVSGDESSQTDMDRINEYLSVLERQMLTARSARGWRAFEELADIAANFDLILDVNEPEARRKPLPETARIFAQLFGKQRPVGGMAGTVNRTLVRQFRLPGYPLVLITTELLQEGEDLHTFCSDVQHYGISWTPSSMEQRIGRIDRVRSETDRRLSKLKGPPSGDEKLQVLFPHLQDTIEVLQVRRVLERMDTFLRMVHEDLGTAGSDGNRKIDVEKEAHVASSSPPQLGPLRTAFGVRDSDLEGEVARLAVSSAYAKGAEQRFRKLRSPDLHGLDILWETEAPRGMLLGTVRLISRQQPFTLILQSFRERLLVRCISPIGRVSPRFEGDLVLSSIGARQTRVGAIETNEVRTYDLTVEEDVLLAVDSLTDAQRVALMLKKVTEEADRLEKELLGIDQPLSKFRRELEKEPFDEE